MIGSKRVYKAVVACIYLLVLVMIYSFSQVDVVKDVKKSEDRIPPLVEQKLREKLAKFENTILNKCREKAIKDAELFVDSLVSEELNLHSGDTLYFPAKPVRPELPKPIKLNDSTSISPILK